MKKLVIGKEYYVDAAHLRAAFSARDEDEQLLRRLESIMLIEDAGVLKTVTIIPATICEIFANPVIGEAYVKVWVGLGALEEPIVAVVDSDKIYEKVSKPATAKKVDPLSTWYCKCNLNPYDYTPERIIYNNPATIVFWKDGTKTVVKKNEKEKYNSYNAFCAALAKKIYGTNSEVNRIVRSGYNQKVTEGQKKLEEFKKKVEKARKAKKKGEKK